MRRIAIIYAFLAIGLLCGSVANAATPAEIEAAIHDGLAWLESRQNADSSWGTSRLIGETGLVVKKFEHHAILEGFDNPFNPAYPYHEEVATGIAFMLLHAAEIDITGDPADTDGNGKAIGFRYAPGASMHTYETAIALMVLVETNTPDAVIVSTNPVVNGKTYYQVAVDVMNWLVLAQVDSGPTMGGAGYEEYSGGADGSNTGWWSMGLAFAESDPPHGFNLTIPAIVKTRLNSWIDYIQNDMNGDPFDGGAGCYSPNGISPDVNILETGNLLFEMKWYGDNLSVQRVKDAITYMVRAWHLPGLPPNSGWWSDYQGWFGNYHAMFTLMKGLEAYQLDLIDSAGMVGSIDWFDEVSDSIVAAQHPIIGSWGPDWWDNFATGGDSILSTVWALLTLQKVTLLSPPEYCADVKIEKVHDALQGHFTEVSITVEHTELDMGGFDFLIAYDASALAFMEATPGQLLEDCEWEYFTYRYGVEGNCGDACPSGLLRIIAIAETNNGPNHPACYGPPDTDPHELASLRFFVTNDRTYECQYVPIYFFWDDCNDNSISSVDGEVLYIDLAIFDFEGNLIWNEDDDDEFPEDARIPFVGAPDYCLNPDPDKPSAERCIKFIYGGIDIVCADSIDLRGDINVNGIPNEIADAVMFANYFISGLIAFGNHVEASIAASDVNADGIPLSIADFVYMIRIITGDAPPYPKSIPYATEASVSTLVNHSAAAVSAEAPTDIGAGYFVFNYTGLEIGEPLLINAASDMTIKYRDDGRELKVLVYSMKKGIKIPAGNESIFAIPIKGRGEIDMVEVQLSDYYGNLLDVNIDKQATMPREYAVHQNYPNPFNLSTTIMFELPVATHVKIEVFNVLGQKITTLHDGSETAGVHSISWNGTDESNRIVSSGIYLYRITTAGFTAEKKMVLMK
jgi:hypothetical protein